MVRKTPRFVIWSIIISAILGSLFGEILRRIIPDSPPKAVILNPFEIGLSPVNLDLLFFKLNFGFSLSLNLFTLIFAVIFLFILYKL